MEYATLEYMTNKQFMSKAIAELVADGVTVRLEKAKRITSAGAAVAGVFDETNKTLRIATGLPEDQYFVVFCHELCHYYQMKDKVFQTFPNQIWGLFFGWLAGEVTLTKEEARKAAALIGIVELDCEKRTVALFKKHKLKVDLEEYHRGANAYVMFYTLAAKYKSWGSGRLDKIPGLYELMPSDRFLKRYDRVPKKVERLVAEHCFKMKSKV